jgi:hypothetical protein
LPDKCIAEIVDQVVADDIGVAAGNSFAVIGDKVVSRKPWKLRGLRFAIVLQIAAYEQRLVPVSGNFVIQLYDVGVERYRVIAGESVTCGVQASPLPLTALPQLCSWAKDSA